MPNKDRYYKHICLDGIGPAGQKKIQQAKILAVGAGGLGSPILLYLAAAGVGHLGIADEDDVEQSNLQRQVLYGQDDVGRPKTKQACEKLKQQHPQSHFSKHPRLNDHNAKKIIAPYDLVMDATDNHKTRHLIDNTCKNLQKPWIYGSVDGFSLQIAAFAADSPVRFADVFTGAEDQNLDKQGLLATIPGVAGTIQATEALKIITGAGNPLFGRLLLGDLKTMSFEVYTIG
jgi:adenylyltransferase/sulfurtransferase